MAAKKSEVDLGKENCTNFSGCLQATAGTFLGNARLFGKVYFPRVVMLIATCFSKLITFGAQFLLFIVFVAWYVWKGNVHLIWWCLLTPLIFCELALLAMGVGMILASLTTKYRDFQVLVGFGIQLWMYATPIVYPISRIPGKWRWLLHPYNAIERVPVKTLLSGDILSEYVGYGYTGQAGRQGKRQRMYGENGI